MLHYSNKGKKKNDIVVQTADYEEVVYSAGWVNFTGYVGKLRANFRGTTDVVRLD